MGDNEDQKLIDDFLSSIIDNYNTEHNLKFSEGEINKIFSTLKHFIVFKDIDEIDIAKNEIRAEKERWTAVRNEMAAFWKLSLEEITDDFLIKKGVTLNNDLILNLDILRQVVDLSGLIGHILKLLHDKGVESGFVFTDVYVSKVNPQTKFGRLVSVKTINKNTLNFYYTLMGIWNDKNDPAMAAGAWSKYTLEKYDGVGQEDDVDIVKKNAEENKITGLGETIEVENKPVYNKRIVNAICKQTRALCVGSTGGELAKGKQLLNLFNSFLTGNRYSFFDSLNPNSNNKVDDVKEFFLDTKKTDMHIINMIWEIVPRKEINLMTLFPYLEVCLFGNAFLTNNIKRISGLFPRNWTISNTLIRHSIAKGQNKYKLICENRSCEPCSLDDGHNAHSLDIKKVKHDLRLIDIKVKDKTITNKGCFPLSGIHHLPFCKKMIPVLTDKNRYRSNIVEKLIMSGYNNTNNVHVTLQKEKFQTLAETINAKLLNDEPLVMDGFLRKSLEDIRTQAKLGKEMIENVINDYITTLSRLAYDENNRVPKQISTKARKYFNGVENKNYIKFNRHMIDMTRPIRFASGNIIHTIFTKSQGVFCQLPLGDNYNIYSPQHCLLLCSMSLDSTKRDVEKNDVSSILNDNGGIDDVSGKKKNIGNNDDEDEEDEDDCDFELKIANSILGKMGEPGKDNIKKKRINQRHSDEDESENDNDDIYDMKPYKKQKQEISHCNLSTYDNYSDEDMDGHVL